MVPNRKSVVCILAAMLLLLLAIPSFASSGSEAAETQSTEAIDQLDQTQATEVTDSEDQQSTEEDQQSTEATEQAGQTEENVQTEEPDAEERSEKTAPAAPAEEAAEKAEPAEETLEKAAPSAKANSGLPANNTKVNYTSAGSHPVKFTVKTGGYTFKGTCATLGVDNAKSGKATVKRISNDSRIAKLVYYYGYKKGWWQGKNSSKKATTVLGFTDSSCTENAKQCIEALIQRDNMGWSDFWAARKVGKYRMYSTDSFMREINDLYKNTDVSKITIPDDVIFEMFHGTTSSSSVQDFYAWRYKEIPTSANGYVAVEKVSGDVSITE